MWGADDYIAAMRDSMIAALEWFWDELATAPDTEDLHRDLQSLVQDLATFPVQRVFQLRDLDSPYLLSDVLRAFSARAAACKADRTLSESERSALTPAVDALITRARSLTGRLDARLAPAGSHTPEQLRLPPGAVLQRLLKR